MLKIRAINVTPCFSHLYNTEFENILQSIHIYGTIHCTHTQNRFVDTLPKLIKIAK